MESIDDRENLFAFDRRPPKEKLLLLLMTAGGVFDSNSGERAAVAAVAAVAAAVDDDDDDDDAAAAAAAIPETETPPPSTARAKLIFSILPSSSTLNPIKPLLSSAPVPAKPSMNPLTNTLQFAGFLLAAEDTSAS